MLTHLEVNYLLLQRYGITAEEFGRMVSLDAEKHKDGKKVVATGTVRESDPASTSSTIFTLSQYEEICEWVEGQLATT